jgi:hypothetical protein
MFVVKYLNYFGLVIYSHNKEFSRLRNHSIFLLLSLDRLADISSFPANIYPYSFDCVHISMRQYVKRGELSFTLSLTTELNGNL